MAKKSFQNQKNSLILSVAAILAFGLAACSPTSPTETAPTATSAAPVEAPTVSMEATAPVEATATLPAATTEPSTGMDGACPVGKWELADFSSYFSSVQAMVEGTDISITDDGVTGQAWFEFKPDGSGVFSANQFQQSFTVNADLGGSALDVPASVLIHGTSTASYTVEGDQITLDHQQPGDLTITMTMMGQSGTLANELLGEPGSIRLYQFNCPDANTLRLKVIAVEQDLNPITLTRIP